ncbi:hypothetical protein NPIL_214831 [Nephila pilipes]|uniref:Uncharacterized protein n=1 Tax=Nephila pilipes TaxID=299642 RepID=A0A8X6TE70_NEPPI|nr:hypothetical protein NPIL_214831 [Nephila pilipes]
MKWNQVPKPSPSSISASRSFPPARLSALILFRSPSSLPSVSRTNRIGNCSWPSYSPSRRHKTHDHAWDQCFKVLNIHVPVEKTVSPTGVYTQVTQYHMLDPRINDTTISVTKA